MLLDTQNDGYGLLININGAGHKALPLQHARSALGDLLWFNGCRGGLRVVTKSQWVDRGCFSNHKTWHKANQFTCVCTMSEAFEGDANISTSSMSWWRVLGHTQEPIVIHSLLYVNMSKNEWMGREGRNTSGDTGVGIHQEYYYTCSCPMQYLS